MAYPSRDDSNEQFHDPLQDYSFSSLESTNKHEQHQQSDSSKNADNQDGSPAYSVQGETEPLSGNPYFMCILSKSNAESPYQLVIPRNFYPLLPAALVPVSLCYGSKRWELSYFGDRSLRRFDTKWKNFAVDNNLKIGDACIFELMDGKDLRFKVQILDGAVPDVLYDPLTGCDSAAPILID